METPSAADAQAPHYAAVTTDFLKTTAQRLKQDLEDGSVLLADLHAMELRLALQGVLPEEMPSKISILEQLSAQDKHAPQLTVGFVPAVDKLIQELDAPNLGGARSYSEQLAVQLHRVQEQSTREQANSSLTGDVEFDRYFQYSSRLQSLLWKGDVAGAADMAVKLQSAEDASMAGKKRTLIKARDFYNINDALGRAAFLRKDYLAASDYLLKAGDTPTGDPALGSFGPDLCLAQALLKAGYKDVVLTFLERCRSFWPSPQLTEWISVLRNGGSPNFEKNIFSGKSPTNR